MCTSSYPFLSTYPVHDMNSGSTAPSSRFSMKLETPAYAQGAHRGHTWSKGLVSAMSGEFTRVGSLAGCIVFNNQSNDDTRGAVERVVYVCVCVCVCACVCECVCVCVRACACVGIRKKTQKRPADTQTQIHTHRERQRHRHRRREGRVRQKDRMRERERQRDRERERGGAGGGCSRFRKFQASPRNQQRTPSCPRSLCAPASQHVSKPARQHIRCVCVCV